MAVLRLLHLNLNSVSTVLLVTRFLLAAVWSCHLIKDKTLRLITIIMSHLVQWGAVLVLVLACIELSSVDRQGDEAGKLNATTTNEQMAQKYQTSPTMPFN